MIHAQLSYNACISNMDGLYHSAIPEPFLTHHSPRSLDGWNFLLHFFLQPLDLAILACE